MIPKRHFVPVQVVRERVHSGFSFRMKFSFWYEASFILVSLKTGNPVVRDRGGSRIFFRRGCTRLLRYFNTNKPHSFFFCRIPVVLENRRSSRGGGVRTPCTLPLDPPLRDEWCMRPWSGAKSIRVERERLSLSCSINKKALKKRRGRRQRQRKRQKAIGFDLQNNNFARASRFVVHFFAVTARLRPEKV